MQLRKKLNKSNVKALIFLFLMCCLAALCSCGKTQLQPEPTCRRVLILSEKFTREKVYLKTDTSYQDILCGHWLELFKENKKFWDLDTGFVVCDRDLFERRVYIVK
jgi:hypothetical protein